MTLQIPLDMLGTIFAVISFISFAAYQAALLKNTVSSMVEQFKALRNEMSMEISKISALLISDAQTQTTIQDLKDRLASLESAPRRCRAAKP